MPPNNLGRIKRLLAILLVSSVVLSGCKNQEGVERSIVTKRKYSKGWHWQGFKGKKVNTEKKLAERADIDKMEFKKAPFFALSNSQVDRNDVVLMSYPEVTQTLFMGMTSTNGISTEDEVVKSDVEAELDEVYEADEVIAQLPSKSFESYTEEEDEEITEIDLLNIGQDESKLEKSTSIAGSERNSLSSYSYRTMAGGGIIGTSFLVSGSAMFFLFFLIGILVAFGGVRYGRNKLSHSQRRKLTTAGLVLGGIVVVSSSVAVLASLMA